MRLVLFGPPGAGKGTQAQFLTARLGVPKISTGEMLRDAAELGTPVGIEAKRYTDQGQLVPDATIIKLVEERLKQQELPNGYLLDGFPRTVIQARCFERWLRQLGQKLDAVINLEVGDDVIVERISNRRECPTCHQTYHLVSRPPEVDEICDRCGTKLAQRYDDRADVVRERLRVYHQRTEPVLAFYRQKGQVIAIQGDRPVAEVTDLIVAALDERKKQQG